MTGPQPDTPTDDELVADHADLLADCPESGPLRPDDEPELDDDDEPDDGCDCGHCFPEPSRPLTTLQPDGRYL